MKNKVKKVVSKAMKVNAKEMSTELKNCPNGMFRLGIGLKTDSK